jgi:thymidylate synthase
MINSYQQQYYDITKRLINQPHKIGDSRIGKINSRFCEQIRIDLNLEFPIMDIKWIKFSNVVHELLWMVRGETNIKYLVKNDCNIWNKDAHRYYKEKYSKFHKENRPERRLPIPYVLSEEEFIDKCRLGEYIRIPVLGEGFKLYYYGDMDKIYGYQWRKFCGDTDQIQNVIDKLLSNPDDRRMIITGHNPSDIENDKVGLPSCHNYTQFYTTLNKNNERELSTMVHIRSNDWFLGQPYNVVQYSLLTHMIAKLVGMKLKELVINITDCHLYHEHFKPAEEWLKRFDDLPTDNTYKLNNTYYRNTLCKSVFKLNGDQKTINDYKFEDFELKNYDPQPYIKAKLLS